MCPKWMQGGVCCACLGDAANEWLLTFLEMNTHQRESPSEILSVGLPVYPGIPEFSTRTHWTFFPKSLIG